MKELFDYRDGMLFWKVAPNRRIIVGSEAGCQGGHGYWQIKLGGKLYRRCRLVWLWHYGEEPKDQIDHRNGDKLDDRIENLRDATYHQNQANRGTNRNNTSGYKGVHYREGRRLPWTAQIKHNGKIKHLGTFATAEEASQAYQEAANEIQGEFAYHKRD